MTKIDIISGFLGAGKTTLIKKLLKEALSGSKVVLIENEFGEIGIDGGFLKESGIEITEMNSGCICCTLVGDFGKALKDVITQYQPDRVIIEPSGVGKLSDVIKAVEEVKKDFEDVTLNSFTTVVDVNKAKMYIKNFGEFFNDQIENANTIILSRTGKVSNEKLEKSVNAIKEHSNAVIITTDWSELTGNQILSTMENAKVSIENLLFKEKQPHNENHECCCNHHSNDADHKCCCGHHHADEVFESIGITTPRRFKRKDIEKILNVLAWKDDFGTILRAKGIIQSDSSWLEFDLTPGEFEVRDGQVDVTGKICIIGSNLKKDEIKALFE